MYEGIKQLHLLTIALSAALLTVRYAMMMANSGLTQAKFFRVFPHVNDSLLLLTGLILMFMTGFTPLAPGGLWLSEKFTCVIAYIALGFFSLKMARNNLLRTFAFFGALGWLAMAGKVAVSKVPMLLG
ncbi:SirB2 family protein [Vibrio sp. WXL103]|uniref:SirB2 family protein n=1 Tax=unclassified Vibrio TaxID=2614977 RepID=UPI0030E56FB9